MDFFSLLGVNFGTAGVPHYQDLSFKLNFPVRKGVVTFFGLGGLSSIAMYDSKAEDVNLYTNEGQDLDNWSKMGASGVSWMRYLTSKTYAKFILSGFWQNGGTRIDTLDANKNPTPYFDHDISEYRLSLTALTGTKFSAGFSTKAGIIIDQMGYTMGTYSWDQDSLRMTKRVKTNKSLGEGGYRIRTFLEANYKISDRLIITPGVHLLYYTLTETPSLEPRLGLSWNYGQHRRISLGYGKHAKTQPLSAYYLGSYLPDGKYVETNLDMDFTKSHQVVLGHDWNITSNLRLKTELYYQYLYDVPVEERPSYFSLLNSGAGWGVGAEDSLVNRGTGRNMGAEITFEKFLSRGYYYLFTASVFDSKYEGSDRIERNTAFNGNFVINALAGKEFPIKQKSVFGIDLKVAYAGGVRYIPLDVEESMSSGSSVYDLSDPYKDKYPNYFKSDIKFTYRQNGRKITQEYILFIENFTNHKNMFMELYSPTAKEIKTIYQLGFFPMMQYRISF
jgi:hypothetical protein